MRKITSVLAFILLANLTIAQDLVGTWSGLETYTKKINGLFIDFVGSNSKYVYSRNSSGRQLILVAHDKNSMKEATSVALFNPKEAKDPTKYKGLRYHKTIIFENTIYVFWLVDSKAKDELYVESYDSNLKKLNALKKVYELTSSKSDLRKAELFIMGNQKVGEKIIIGGELSASEGQNIKMEYKVLNADFTFASANQVTLPVVAVKARIFGFGSRGSNALSSDYQYGDDGNLHLKTDVRVTDEEKKDLKKGEFKTYPLYSIVNVSSGKIYTYTMKADGKNILHFDFLVTKSTVKVFGFFDDLSKGGRIDGIFSGTIDPKTYTMSSFNFTYFTETQLNTLFAKDKEDANKAGLFSSKKKKEDSKEALSGNYVIEDVQAIDKDNLLIFCDKMINWEVTTCDSKGQNCRTTYYCDKHNVTVFKINTKGDIVWASNLDRVKVKYSGWNIYDIKVINKGDKFYVSYGSDYNVLEGQGKNGNNKKQKKSKDQKNDRFEYAIVDYKTGNIQRKEYQVNAVNAAKEDLKKINVLDLETINNQFYINYSKKHFGYLFTGKKTGFTGKIAPGA
jgi:hypothetical protein